MHRVAVLALPGVIPFELAIPGRIFGSALDADGQAVYEVATCTVDGRPVPSDADYSIVVNEDASLLARADTVVVPATERLDEILHGERLSAPLAQALTLIRPGTRVVSICIASYVLAAAGLLDGRRATTHWRRAAHFARTFPLVRVDADVLFVDDGDVLTSAGAAAGIDLCLHLVRRRLRRCGCQPRRKVVRRSSDARRRAGSVHRPSSARSGIDEHGARTQLGARTPQLLLVAR